MARIQLYLDEAMHRRLSRLARRQGRAIPELIRDALVRSYEAPRSLANHYPMEDLRLYNPPRT